MRAMLARMSLRAGVVLLFIVSGCASETIPPRADAGPRRDGSSPPVDAAEMTADGGTDEDATGSAQDAALGSRCTVDPTTATCTHETLTVPTGSLLPARDVHYQVPLGTAPAAGFPAVIAFQGAAVSAELTWTGHITDLYGLYNQTLVVAALLDAGYAVITPEAGSDGLGYYDTNVPPYATFWDTSPDHQLMLGVFATIEAGGFGPIDASRLFAAGFSSGGYMTSRMAVSYPGRFRALAIHSASYATCSGAVCLIPTALPTDHPPTLFLHGALDPIVPVATMQAYEAQLSAQGIATHVVVDAALAHQWIPVAPAEVLAWFELAR